MSTLLVSVQEVEEIKAHLNAESLELIEILGWQTVVQKNSFEPGDLGVYFPPDSLLTEQLANRLGVWKYTSKGRVRGIRLRGEPSYGLLVPISAFPELQNQPIGVDVSEKLGVTKWEPDPDLITGDMETPHPAFHEYTEIESYGNFPNIFNDDEFVVLTEKIHGSNNRVALIENEWMAGSHTTRKKMPDLWSSNLYWSPLTYVKDDYDRDVHSDVQQMLMEITEEYKAKSVILFSEIYGWVQKLRYGHKPGKISFAAIDLSVDRKYLDWHDFERFMKQYKIPFAPVIEIATIEFIRGIGLDKFSSGTTKVLSPERTPINHIREGFVMRPVHERTDPKLGRVILKHKSIDYLAGNYE